MLRDLRSFVEIGVDILRIEGSHYDAKLTGELTALYRKYLDMAGMGEYEVSGDDWKRLVEISPRDFGMGAYSGKGMEVAEACESLPTNEVVLRKERAEAVA